MYLASDGMIDDADEVVEEADGQEGDARFLGNERRRCQHQGRQQPAAATGDAVVAVTVVVAVVVALVVALGVDVLVRVARFHVHQVAVESQEEEYRRSCVYISMFIQFHSNINSTQLKYSIVIQSHLNIN